MSVIAALVMSVCLLATTIALAAPYDLGKHDLGGATVRFVCWGNLLPESDLELMERKQQAEEMFNCKVEMLVFDWSSYTTNLMSRLLSGDSALDIWMVHADHFWALVGQDAYLPMNRVLPADYFKRWGDVSFEMTFLGNIYSFSNPNPDPTEGHVLFFNKTMFEREGLESPYDLVASGNWTWDKFTELARKLTKDLNGDGTNDVYAICNLTEVTPLIGYTNGASPTKVDENGKVVFAFDSPEAIQTLEQIYQWCVVDGVGLRWNPEAFAQGRAATIYAPALNYPNYVNMQDDWGVVPFPIGPSATTFVYPTRGGMTWTLPRNSADPVAMVAVWDYIFEQRYPEDEKQAAFEEGVMNWVRDRESFETILAIQKDWNENGCNAVFTHRRLLAPLGPDGYWLTAAGQKTPASAMAEQKPVIQAILDEALKQ